MAVFWASYATSVYLGRAWAQALRTTTRPPVVNGLPLRLAPFATLVRDSAPGLEAERYLVLVASDDCPYSEAEIPAWTELLRGLAFRRADVVLLISLKGRRIPAAIEPVVRRRGVPYRLSEVANRVGFAEATGLAWTPETLVLDRHLRVRLATERVSDPASALIKRWFAEADHRPRALEGG